MSIINDAINDEAQLNEIPQPDAAPEFIPQPDAAPLPRFDFSFLKAETGAGSIEDYIEHPLNFDGSRGIAQILRGATGIAGSLNLAVIDIALGAIQVLKDKKQDNQIKGRNTNETVFDYK